MEKASSHHLNRWWPSLTSWPIKQIKVPDLLHFRRPGVWRRPYTKKQKKTNKKKTVTHPWLLQILFKYKYLQSYYFTTPRHFHVLVENNMKHISDISKVHYILTGFRAAVRITTGVKLYQYWQYTPGVWTVVCCRVRECRVTTVNRMWPRQNGSHFPDDILNLHFRQWKERISVENSMKFVLMGLIRHLLQVTAWRQIVI